MADRRARPAPKDAGPVSKGSRKSVWRRALPPPSTPPAVPTPPKPTAPDTAERAASVVEAAVYQELGTSSPLM